MSIGQPFQFSNNFFAESVDEPSQMEIDYEDKGHRLGHSKPPSGPSLASPTLVSIPLSSLPPYATSTSSVPSPPPSSSTVFSTSKPTSSTNTSVNDESTEEVDPLSVSFPSSLPLPSELKLIKSYIKDLASLDSRRFGAYIMLVQQSRTLTESEKNDVRKIRRRINNRESARRSRKEKKTQTKALQEQIELLTHQLSETKLVRILARFALFSCILTRKECATLAESNRQIRTEITFTYTLIQSNPVLLELFRDVRKRHEARLSEQNRMEKRRKLE